MLTVEQLIALNDEIRMLVAAGIPLDAGLRQMAALQRGQVASVANDLAKQLESGRSLGEAIQAGGATYPPVYGAIVEAGIRAGRLPAALEGVTNYASELVDLRRRLGLALLYPFVVVWLAYELGVAIVARGVAAMHVLTIESRVEEGWLLKAVSSLFATVENWVWLPRVFLILLACWWFVSRRRDLTQLTSLNSLFGWVPGVRWIAYRFRCSCLAELLALLVENKVPLPDGLTLAAAATGDARMQAAASSMNRALHAGDTALSSSRTGGIPPLLTWLLSRPEEEHRLANSLRLAGEMYRRQAQRWIHFVGSTLPVLAGVGIGGIVTLIYGLTLFGPLVQLLKALSNDVIPM